MVKKRKNTGWMYVSAAVAKFGLSKSRLQAAIEDGTVESQEVKNPHWASGPRARIVKLADVLAHADELRLTCDEREKKQTASQRGKQLVERRRKELLEWIANLKIRVRREPMDRLTEMACRHYNGLWLDRGRDDKFASPKDSEDFLRRITVNMLRHEGTEYEEYLVRVWRQVGAEEARVKVKQRVLKAIAVAYPDLVAECHRQAVELGGVDWSPEEVVAERLRHVRKLDAFVEVPNAA